MSSKILVAGGAGFIGSNLCKRLLKEGNEVICIDNLYTGCDSNISKLKENSKFKFIKHDITEPMSYDIEVDKIYNLACPASPPHYQKDPIFTLRTCFIGSYNMLELAKKNNAIILQASTSEVYGDPEVHPQPESYRGNVNPIGIRACYDEGKRCAETLFFDYKRYYGVRIKVVRIFNTYGPNMDPLDGRVVSNLIVQAIKGENITVYGDGNQTRSFCYVEDLIDGLIRTMNTNEDFIGPVNLGNPEEFTINELAEKIINHIGAKCKIEYKDLPQDDPLQRKPVIDIANRKLGWIPKVKLDDGLVETISYFKAKIGINN